VIRSLKDTRGLAERQRDLLELAATRMQAAYRGRIVRMTPEQKAAAKKRASAAEVDAMVLASALAREVEEAEANARAEVWREVEVERLVVKQAAEATAAEQDAARQTAAEETMQLKTALSSAEAVEVTAAQELLRAAEEAAKTTAAKEDELAQREAKLGGDQAVLELHRVEVARERNELREERARLDTVAGGFEGWEEEGPVSDFVHVPSAKRLKSPLPPELEPEPEQPELEQPEPEPEQEAASVEAAFDGAFAALAGSSQASHAKPVYEQPVYEQPWLSLASNAETREAVARAQEETKLLGLLLRQVFSSLWRHSTLYRYEAAWLHHGGLDVFLASREHLVLNAFRCFNAVLPTHAPTASVGPGTAGRLQPEGSGAGSDGPQEEAGMLFVQLGAFFEPKAHHFPLPPQQQQPQQQQQQPQQPQQQQQVPRSVPASVRRGLFSDGKVAGPPPPGRGAKGEYYALSPRGLVPPPDPTHCPPPPLPC
jgi:hypothetical protein